MKIREEALTWWRKFSWPEKESLIEKYRSEFVYKKSLPPEAIAMSSMCIEIMYKAEENISY